MTEEEEARLRELTQHRDTLLEVLADKALDALAAARAELALLRPILRGGSLGEQAALDAIAERDDYRTEIIALHASLASEKAARESAERERDEYWARSVAVFWLVPGEVTIADLRAKRDEALALRPRLESAERALLLWAKAMSNGARSRALAQALAETNAHFAAHPWSPDHE